MPGFLLRIVFLMIVSTAVFGDDSIDYIVEKGVAHNTSPLPASDWKKTGEWLVCGGENRYLFGCNSYDPAKFTVESEIIFDKFGGTAPTFILGEFAFGFDGGNGGLCFWEGPGLTAQSFPGTANSFVPGSKFILRAEGDNGQVTLSIDDKKLATVSISTEKPVNLGFRPNRNIIRIRNVKVYGKIVNRDNLVAERNLWLRSTVPTVVSSFSLKEYAAFQLKSSTAPATGEYAAELRPLPEGKAEKFDLTVTADGFVSIPPEKLANVYASSSIDLQLKPVELILQKEGQTVLSNRFVIYDPQNHSGFPKCEVRVQNERPEFYVNGKPVGTITGRLGRVYYSSRFFGSAVHEFGEAGINGNLILVTPYYFMDTKTFDFDCEAFLNELNEIINRSLCENPDAEFDLQWRLVVPPEWGTMNPDELIRLDNGVETLRNSPGRKLQPSYASEKWRKLSGGILDRALRSMAGKPYADRITHITLCYANCEEWNHWGYHEKAFVDISRPMQCEFGKWLKTSYDSVENLRKAWGRDDVNFDSENLVPVSKDRLSGGKTFRFGGPEVQSSIDYCEFFQHYAVSTIEYFARIAKEATDGRLLVGSYYGYYLGHYGNNPHHFQDSGHYGMRYMLRSPWIDFIGGPYPYEGRRNSAMVNGITSSVALHGKVWLSEGDQRTHYSGEEQRIYGTTDNLAESIAIARRDYLMNRDNYASYYFYDFIWNWYRDPEFMDTVARLKKIDDFLRPIPQRYPAETALVVSEETIPYLANTANAAAFQEFSNAAFKYGYNQMWGAPCDTYLESDLGRIDFSQYKVVIFANAFYASDKTIRLCHQRVMKDNRTVIFLYAPGIIGKDHKPDPERSRKFTSIGLKLLEDRSYERVSMFPEKAPYMLNKPISPMAVIDDNKAKIFADYPDGTPAGGWKRLPGCKVMVLCHPAPNGAFMREILRRCKVHIFPQNDYDQYFFSGPVICVYSRKGGQKSLALPRTAEIVADLFSGKVLGRKTRKIEFTMPVDIPDTRLIFTGSAKEWNSYVTLINSSKPR